MIYDWTSWDLTNWTSRFLKMATDFWHLVCFESVEPCLVVFSPGTKVMNALRTEHAVDLYRYKAKMGPGAVLENEEFITSRSHTM